MAFNSPTSIGCLLYKSANENEVEIILSRTTNSISVSGGVSRTFTSSSLNSSTTNPSYLANNALFQDGVVPTRLLILLQGAGGGGAGGDGGNGGAGGGSGGF
jgi:hypothetical protein